MGRCRTATIVAARACLVLTFLASLAGCGDEPAPLPPVPSPTSLPTAEPTFSPVPGTTPSPTFRALLRLTPLRPNPLVTMRAADLAGTLQAVVSGTYCAPAWSTDVLPASLSLPVEPVTGDLLLEWNSSGNTDYINPPGTQTYGLPASYTISTSGDSTDGNDGTWREVVNVSGNSVRTREHRFPSAGARWVRLTVTSVVPGPLGNMVSIDQVELHDASSGTDDTVFFLGDSITAAAFTRCPATQPSFAALVRTDSPDRFPAMIDGGVGGVNSAYGVSIIDDWLALNPDFRVWAIGYGTNDAWQKVPPATFEANMQTLVDRVVAAGRVPVLARIPFAAKGPADGDVRALNEVIDRVAARNGLPDGPDLYAWFSAHRDEIGPDGVHPTDAGARSINRLWYDALRPLYKPAPSP